jgi:hypothetical protein
MLTPQLPLQHWASAASVCDLPVAERTIASSSRALRWRADETNRAQTADSAPRAVAGTVLVAGDKACGALVDRYGRQCLSTARALGFPLLEFSFATRGRDSALVDVNPLPSLTEPCEGVLTGQLLASMAADASS